MKAMLQEARTRKKNEEVFAKQHGIGGKHEAEGGFCYDRSAARESEKLLWPAPNRKSEAKRQLCCAFCKGTLTPILLRCLSSSTRLRPTIGPTFILRSKSCLPVRASRR